MSSPITNSPPDLSTRPHELFVERRLKLSPDVVFTAWTTGLDSWFAAPGTLALNPEVGAPFFFETHFEGGRHPHYGRFIRLEKNRLIEITWITSDPGTRGAETVVTVELEPMGADTKVTLRHAGFADVETMQGHQDAWPHVFDHLEETLGTHSE